MAASLLTLQAAQQGLQLNLTQSTNPPNFAASGSAVKLLITNPTNTVTTYPCSVSNNVPVYVTDGTEMPTPGKYQVQLVYTANGERYDSAIATITVLANLL
jgi:hypothetical protein